MSDTIQRLEEKIAYLERHVAEQDRAMLEQARELDRLRRDFAAFRALMTRAESPSRSAAEPEERPPHY